MYFEKPKIAILSLHNSYAYGGVYSCLKTAYDFCSEHFSPTVFCLNFDKDISTSIRSLKFSSGYKQEIKNGMHHVHIGARWAFWEPGHYAFNLSAWQTVLQDYHYFFVVSGTVMAAYPLVQLKKPFMMWVGTPYEADRQERVRQMNVPRRIINACATPNLHAIEKECLVGSSYTLAISSYAKEQFEALESKAIVETCGFPIWDDTHEKSPVLHENCIIAVGRFSDPRKNIAMLLRVFEIIYQQDPSILLYVVGSKPNYDIIAPYEKNESFGNIIFTGHVTDQELTHLYQKSRVMLISSYQEGLGIVGLEALKQGVPIVATDCGGTKDYVIPDMTGFLVPINDDASMAQHALSIVQSDELFDRLSHNGRFFIQKHYSRVHIHETFKKGFASVYPELKIFFDNPEDELMSFYQTIDDLL
jgi:glycosyltransferase involved in cell wall biosynthesis